MSMTGRYGPQPWYRRVPYSTIVSMNQSDETTAATLHQALRQTKTTSYGWSSRMEYYDVDCDEVYPDIYIGDGETAKNKAFLKRLGITHVLNTAEGQNLSMVNTDKNFYRDTQIKYMGLSLTDLPTTRISIHFMETSDFIHRALLCRGRVYVHCLMGLSRSSTCVIAYLMLKRGMTAVEAITTIKQKRNIYPNEGFLEQLAELDNALRRKKESPRFSAGTNNCNCFF